MPTVDNATPTLTTPTTAEARLATAASFDGEVQLPFTLTSEELDFGGSEFGDGRPTNSAYLGWSPNEQTNELVPFVSGYMHYLNAAGVRAGIQLRTYDLWGNRLSSRIERVPVVQTQDQQVSPPQFMFADFSSPNIYRANVTIVIDVSDPETGSAPVWHGVTGRNFYVFEKGSPIEQVNLSGIEHFFGSAGWSNGQPTGPGYLTWFTSGETVAPRVTGSLHAENARTTEVSLRLTAHDMFHEELGREVLADSLEVDDDGHVGPHAVDWSPVSDPRIHHAVLELVIRNGAVWERLDATTLFL